MLVYIHNLGEEKIVQSALANYHAKLLESKKNIISQLEMLQKEVRFLASLDLMNDMIVGDRDKRIAQILKQKHEDLGLHIDLYTLSMDGNIIASTNKKEHITFDHTQLLLDVKSPKNTTITTPHSILFYTPIIASLQKDLPIGYLIFEYPLSNLTTFTDSKEGALTFIVEEATGKIWSKNPIANDPKHLTDPNTLLLHEELEEPLGGYRFYSLVDKQFALGFLDDFVEYIWMLFGLGFVVIGFVSGRIGKSIHEPIAQLTRATKQITTTADYTTQVNLKGEEEIGELVRNFNVMIQQTNLAFEKLAHENRLRLLRFVQLIDIFNRLMQTADEEVCIQTALGELRSFVPHHDFQFSKLFPSQEETTQKMMLYVSNFRDDTCDYYGMIAITSYAPSTDAHEGKFYHSIATMIMLRLDQIRLIEQTKAASHAKSAFISHMSHELRTPLHTILGSTQYLLAYEQLKEEQIDKVATIESAADHLLGMINDVLDLVQIEAGKVRTDLVTLTTDEVAMMTLDIMSMVELLAHQKEITLTLTNHLTSPHLVTLDKRHLKQILINLITNAIKFTESGQIEVSLERCDTMVCVAIKDSGIGISPSELTTLFEEFTQASSHAKTKQKGNGLGLAISRKLAHLFGGEVTLTSEGLTKGTTATLRLRIIEG